MERPLTAEGLATWLTPREAFRLLADAFGASSAGRIIFQGLRGGIIRAISGTSSWSNPHGGSTLRPPVRIPGRFWEGLTDHVIPDSFWTTGSVRLHLASDARRSTPSEVSFYDVRFEPDAIRALLREASAKEKAKPAPPVSDALLQMWFDVYRKAYEGVEATEAEALESAEGMFPGKLVSRERVRKLLADWKPSEK